MDSGPAHRISPLDLIEFGPGPARARVGERDPGQPTTTHRGQPPLKLDGWPNGCLGVPRAAGRDRR